MEEQSIPEAFAQWAKKATQEQLEEFALAMETELYNLEADDFFGTEGINKRFA